MTLNFKCFQKFHHKLQFKKWTTIVFIISDKLL